MKTLKKKLSAKLSSQGGFTLVEILIVVAIIAILIVVSIPLVSGSLEKAREATDDANMRSAQSMAETYFLLHVDDMTFTGGGTGTAGTCTVYYSVDPDTHQGKITEDADNTNDEFKYGVSESNKGGYVSVTIDENGDITETKWNT